MGPPDGSVPGPAEHTVTFVLSNPHSHPMRQAAVIISHFTDKEKEAPWEEAMEDPKVLASETG